MAEGATGTLEGTVRITASTVTSHYILPAILRPFHDEFPAIAIELVPTDSVENLLLREADIAVRMFRPTQLDLIAKKARRAGHDAAAPMPAISAPTARPPQPDDLLSHTLIGLDRSDCHHHGSPKDRVRPEAQRFRLPHRQPDRRLGTAQGRARHWLRPGRDGRRNARNEIHPANDPRTTPRGVAHHPSRIVSQPSNPCHL